MTEINWDEAPEGVQKEIEDALNNGTVFVRVNKNGTREIIPYHDVIAVPDELGDTHE